MYKLFTTVLLTIALLPLPMIAQTPPSVRNREVPNATLPCSQDEAQWWAELKAAADQVQKTRGGKKERQKYFDLLQLGEEKSYQPPVVDIKPIALNKVLPSYDEEDRRLRINGVVVLMVEIRKDGFIGDVQIRRGLSAGLNSKAEEAARKSTFLPAVKDRKFVNYSVLMEMSFSIY